MLSDEILIERFRSVDPAPNDVETGMSATALLATIDERIGLMQTQESERTEPQKSGAGTRRGLLVAVAAFVVVMLAGALFLFSQPEGDVATDPTTTTVQAQDVGDSRIDAAMVSAADLATEEGYVAAVVPWEHQLVYETGGPQCQLDSDTVRFTELDTLTSDQAMLSLTKDGLVGTVEVMKFVDATVAQEAAPIFERLLASQRGCITDSLTTALGTSSRNQADETIEVDGALGAFLYTFEHDDGSDRTAYVQVAGGIRDDLMYVITFSSNEAPVDNSFLQNLYFITTAASE